MKKILVTSVLVVAALFGSAVLVTEQNAVAQVTKVQEGVDKISTGDSKPLMDTVKTLINVFLFLIGAVAVVMMIYGGFKYVTSAGDSSSVSSAKNTLLYAVIGLVVALTAFAIVNFVLEQFGSTGGSQGVPQNPGGPGVGPEQPTR